MLLTGKGQTGLLQAVYPTDISSLLAGPKTLNTMGLRVEGRWENKTCLKGTVRDDVRYCILSGVIMKRL